MAPVTRRPRLPIALLAPAVTLVSAALTGCSSTPNQPTTQPSSWYDQAKNDPMNYNPSATDDWPSVSGGGISHFDKNAFNKDLDHVLNP